MAKQVNIHDAKTHFSKLVDEVEAGGEVTIARAGKPILRLVKIEAEKPINRQIGFGKHLMVIEDLEAFDAADAEIAAMFNHDKFEEESKL
jgi:prevent-host-death family protein